MRSIPNIFAGLARIPGWAATATAQPPPGGVAEGYELIRITDDADFDDAPQMNNCGQVVFSKRILPTDGQFSTEEIFLWDNGVTRRITNDDVRDAFPDINDHGVIVWSRAVDPGGHFAVARLVPGGEIEILTETPFSDWGPQINNTGRIAWFTCLDSFCRVVEVFLLDSHGLFQISANGQSNQGARINALGTVAWTSYNFRVNPWTSQVFSFWNGMATDHSPCGKYPQAVDINDDRTFAWDTADGIVIEKSNQCRVMHTGIVPRINNPEFVAFTRWHADLQAQIWAITPRGEARQITYLPEQTVVSLRDINDNGDMCAVLGLTNGVQIVQTDILLTRAVRIRADLDLDGDVDLFDFGLLQRFADPDFSKTTPCPVGDLNRDGSADAADVGEFLNAFAGPEE